MSARLTLLVAAACVLGPVGLSSARAGDSEALVEAYLESIDAHGYTINPIDPTTEQYLGNVFPDIDFFEVIFRHYPIAVLPPDGLSSSNVFFVMDGTVFYLINPDDLQSFFLDVVEPVQDADGAADVARSYLRLTEVFSQDGFYAFNEPDVDVVVLDDGEVYAYGSVSVARGGTGSISAVLHFDSDGFLLDDLSETRKVRPGVRPICQATKLLDPDLLVRRMAEQDILVMGSAAKEYLNEQRAKAYPELKEAIDRVWQRIVDEGR